MAEYEKNFLGLLKYVRFIGDEKVKRNIFLSGFPAFYKENISMMNPRPSLRSSGRLNTCMSKAREENPYKNLGRTRRMRSPIRGGKDSNLPLIGMS
jgi:hypothetical protein